MARRVRPGSAKYLYERVQTAEYRPVAVELRAGQRLPGKCRTRSRARPERFPGTAVTAAGRSRPRPAGDARTVFSVTGFAHRSFVSAR